MLTTNEAAERLGLSRQRLYGLVQQGLLQPQRIGRLMFFDEAEVEALAQARSQTGTRLWGSFVANIESAQNGIEYWSTARVAQELGISRAGVHNLIRTGKLRARRSKNTSAILIEADSVRQYKAEKAASEEGAQDFNPPRRAVGRPPKPAPDVAPAQEAVESLEAARIALVQAIDALERSPEIVGKRDIGAARRLEWEVRELKGKVREKLAEVSGGAGVN
jgi:excisionase family DNA binding protein